ncbi:DUF1254 domain-containing protein [bacterium]|nr:DUF1254 domain-containing protein [bacterium]
MEFSDAEVADAFVYVMSRYLVNRQEQIDLGEADIGYNVVKYNPVGSADFVNPNLDVAYLEAWAAVDVDTPAILTIPRIDDRYYTAQLIDEWGEVIVNINERTFPDHPYGTFALIAPAEDQERWAGHDHKACEGGHGSVRPVGSDVGTMGLSLS